MAFAFRSQPLKTLYLLYFSLSTLLVRLPFWILSSIFPSTRPRSSWPFLGAVFVHVVRAVIMMQYHIGLGSPPDPEKEARSADKLGFVWVEPVTDELVSEVAAAVKANNIQPARVSGYWFGCKGSSGRHGGRARPSERILYTLHGGGYTGGKAAPSGGWAYKVNSLISNSAGLFSRAFALEYRLASSAPFPTSNPFPAALLDAVAGYRYLVHDLGFEPEHILVEGDSAGGHLALTLALYLARSQFKDLPPPGGLLLLSPTVDWACTHDRDATSSMTRNYKSDYVHRILANGYTARSLRGALPEAELASNAYLSPASLFLRNSPGFFGNLPPTCIIAGEAEVTVDSMRTLRDRLTADNARGVVVYHEYDDAPHDWLVVNVFKRQSDAALQDIQDWMLAISDTMWWFCL